MNDGIWWFLPSRIRLRIAGVANMISQTTVRPCAVGALGASACVTTPCSAVDSCARISCCWCGGKMSMTRSMVCAALCVCSVASTRWPVSAAVSAVDDGLQVAQLADQDDVRVLPQHVLERLGEARVSTPTSRWLTTQRLCVVQELDRVLDGDDVVAPGAVGQVEQRGQRRGLARAGRAGDQHQAAGQVREARDLLGHAELVAAA